MLQEWAAQKRFVLPEPHYFNWLRNQLAQSMFQIFPGYEFVSENGLLAGLEDFARRESLSIISLDKVYYSYPPMLEISRMVDAGGNDIGLGERAGSKPIEEQLQDLRWQLPSYTKKVALLDDILWTGEVFLFARQLLQNIEIEVVRVYAGIEIEKFETKEGLRGGQWFREQTGLEVVSLFSYPEVIDQICERDFYPGVPLCGRQVAGLENTGAPYLLPFGNPVKWASIPEWGKLKFSKACLERTIHLYATIGRLSGRPVHCEDLGRNIMSLPTGKEPIVEELERALGGIQEELDNNARSYIHY